MIIWTKRLILTLFFCGLITTNVLTLTSAAFNAALSGLMSTALGVHTVSEVLRGKVGVQKKTIARHKAVAANRKRATRRFGTRLFSRTRRVAAKSIAAIPAESIPFIGVAVLIADTGYELYAACETVRELDQLYVELGIEEEAADAAQYGVCDPQLPQAGEVWAGVVEKSGEWLDQARASM